MNGHTPRAVGRYWGCLPPLVMMLFVPMALAIGFGRLTGYLPVTFFDQDAWKQADTANTNSDVRLRMIDHLIRSGRLDGLMRTEVVALLGPPADTSYFSDWNLVYPLGPERGLIRIDWEWLVVRFGASGKVSEYRIVRD